MTFQLHIGIDYSGRETPTSRTPGLQVYAGSGNEEPLPIPTPKAPAGARWNWCRKEIAGWLVEQAKSKTTKGAEPPAFESRVDPSLQSLHIEVLPIERRGDAWPFSRLQVKRRRSLARIPVVRWAGADEHVGGHAPLTRPFARQIRRVRHDVAFRGSGRHPTKG